MPERPHQGGELPPTPVPVGRNVVEFVGIEALPRSFEEDADIEATLESYRQG